MILGVLIRSEELIHLSAVARKHTASPTGRLVSSARYEEINVFILRRMKLTSVVRGQCMDL
jgi:hypothetical protein